MTLAHVYNEMTIIQVTTHKLYIIKKRSNNKVSFVEFIFNSRQFKLMTTGSQLHGAKWPSLPNCVQTSNFRSADIVITEHGCVSCARVICLRFKAILLLFASVASALIVLCPPLIP